MKKPNSESTEAHEVKMCELKKKVRRVMTLARAMCMYGTSDKDRFCCAYPECQAKRPDSLFYADFSVADVYGENAIIDTYKKCCCQWKSNVGYFTELVAVLNHKIWFWYEAGVEEYARLYDKLWKEADAYGCDNFKGEDAAYFFRVLD